MRCRAPIKNVLAQQHSEHVFRCIGCMNDVISLARPNICLILLTLLSFELIPDSAISEITIFANKSATNAMNPKRSPEGNNGVF